MRRTTHLFPSAENSEWTGRRFGQIIGLSTPMHRHRSSLQCWEDAAAVDDDERVSRHPWSVSISYDPVCTWCSVVSYETQRWNEERLRYYYLDDYDLAKKRICDEELLSDLCVLPLNQWRNESMNKWWKEWTNERRNRIGLNNERTIDNAWAH